MATSTITYPSRLPYVPQGPNPSDDFDPVEADYVKFSRYSFNSGGGNNYFNVPNNRSKSGKTHVRSAYIAMPSSLSVQYGANYQQANLGAAGMAATGAFNGRNSDEVISSIQKAADAGLPEAAFNTLAQGLQGIGGVLGLNTSGIDANVLTAIGAGKVMNPYSEQVFQGVGFRTHSFDFKMLARNEEEAQSIQDILEMFKVGMLPAYSGGGGTGSGSLGDMLSKTQGASRRWLTVPDKFLIQFMRMREGSLYAANLDHFKIDFCVLTGMNVNYTPDGQYVAIKSHRLRRMYKDINRDALRNTSTKNLERGKAPNMVYVPAITATLNFTETSIITQEKAVVGY